MAQDIINIGPQPNDGQGDNLRTAFDKTNDNFNQIWTAGPVGSNVRIAGNVISTLQVNQDLALSPNGVGNVRLNNNTIPGANNTWFLGSANMQWRGLYAASVETGNITITGTLTVPGDAVIQGNLTVEGDTIQIGNIVTDTKTIQLANTAGNAIQANGSGITVGANDNIATFLYNSTSNSWVTNLQVTYANGQPIGKLPGGANTQIQFNDSGNFGANANFTYNRATGNFYLGGANLRAVTGNNQPYILQIPGINFQGGSSIMEWDATNQHVDVSNSFSIDGTLELFGNFANNGSLIKTPGGSGMDIKIEPSGNLYLSADGGEVIVSDQTPSTTFNDGALIVLGGVGVDGNINASGNVTGNAILGNITGLTGSITNLDSLNFSVENISALVGNNGVNIGAGGFNNIIVLPTEVIVQNVPLTVAGNIVANQTNGLYITANAPANGIAQVWNFGTTGDLTVPNYIQFAGNTIIGDEPGAGTPYFRIDTPLGYPATITTDADISGNNWSWTFGADGNLTLPTNRSIIVDGGDGVIGPVSDDMVIAWDNEEIRLVSVQGSIEMQADNAFRVQTNYNSGTSTYTSRWEFNQDEIVNITGPSSIVTEAGNLNLQGGRNTLSSGNVTITAINNGVAINTWTFDNSGNLTAPGNISATGNITANSFIGDGSQLTGLPASYSDANVATFLAAYGSNTISTTGNITAGNFIGAGSNVELVAQTEQWVFDTTGVLTVPGNITGADVVSANTFVSNAFNVVTAGNLSITSQYGLGFTGTILEDNGTLELIANGGGGVVLGWDSTYGNGLGNIATVNFNEVGGEGILLRTGNRAATEYNWNFDSAGNLTLPSAGYLLVQTGIIGAGASPAPTLSGFSSIATTGVQGNISASGNLLAAGYANITGNINGSNATFSGNVTGNTAGYTIGYRDIPQVTFSANATAALTDAGKHYYSTTAGNLSITLPDNSSVAFPTGATLTIVVNAAGNVLVDQGTGVTLYQAGASATGNRVVGAYGLASVMKVAANTWVISGTGVY